MPIFRSFRSTVTPFLRRVWPQNLGLLVDPITGAPCGIESPNANGADGVWTPVDITPAQAANPSALMLADLNATYRLNIPPYTRYYSDGNELAALQGTNIETGIQIWYAPVVITAETIIQGTVYVRNVPA